MTSQLSAFSRQTCSHLLGIKLFSGLMDGWMDLIQPVIILIYNMGWRHKECSANKWHRTFLENTVFFVWFVVIEKSVVESVVMVLCLYLKMFF